jgi:hypothetical protein
MGERPAPAPPCRNPRPDRHPCWRCCRTPAPNPRPPAPAVRPPTPETRSSMPDARCPTVHQPPTTDHGQRTADNQQPATDSLYPIGRLLPAEFFEFLPFRIDNIAGGVRCVCFSSFLELFGWHVALSSRAPLGSFTACQGGHRLVVQAVGASGDRTDRLPI